MLRILDQPFETTGTVATIKMTLPTILDLIASGFIREIARVFCKPDDIFILIILINVDPNILPPFPEMEEEVVA